MVFLDFVFSQPIRPTRVCDSFVDDGTPLDYGPAAVTTTMPCDRKMPALSRSRVHDGTAFLFNCSHTIYVLNYPYTLRLHTFHCFAPALQLSSTTNTFLTFGCELFWFIACIIMDTKLVKWDFTSVRLESTAINDSENGATKLVRFHKLRDSIVIAHSVLPDQIHFAVSQVCICSNLSTSFFLIPITNVLITT
ncbi:hypothetical protein BGW80DRAFT_1310769 [Lactifluus volemus]|nr:hypothetical protein BGW80DRAFT_1310769 [Lactifluus volemus]